ncbi:MAG: peroxiredoxin (alkyl hydroperoxide reductase subunit C), partial [Parvicellaceae bacterium]
MVINVVQIVGDFTLEQFKGKYVILFFYPKDFTFVCPTELFASQEKIAEFESRSVQLIGVSMDTEQSHWGWLQMEKNKGGIQGVTYPLVADTYKTISANYDVLVGERDYNEEGNMTATDEMIAYRGLFLIDPNGTVRHQLANDLPLGRNVDEALRMVGALQYFEENG